MVGYRVNDSTAQTLNTRGARSLYGNGGSPAQTNDTNRRTPSAWSAPSRRSRLSGEAIKRRSTPRIAAGTFAKTALWGSHDTRPIYLTGDRRRLYFLTAKYRSIAIEFWLYVGWVGRLRKFTDRRSNLEENNRQ